MTVRIAMRWSIDWAVLMVAIAAPPRLTVLGIVVLVALAATGPGEAADRLLRGVAMAGLALAGTVILYAAA